MDDEKRLAAVIFFGQLEGAEWDFDAMNWKPRPSQ